MHLMDCILEAVQVISWSFIRNEVALIQWDYREFINSKVNTIKDTGDLGSELTTTNHNELQDMFGFNYSGPIVELGIVKAIQKSNCKYAIIQIPGSVIAREFSLIVTTYMENNPNCAVLGMTTHKKDEGEGDRWWGIMPYTMVVNLEHFQKAGRLLFGNKKDRPEANQLFPEVIENNGILSSNGKEDTINSQRLFHGWYWFSKFLQEGQEIHNFTDKMNAFKQYIYYENDQDLKQHKWLIDNMAEYVEEGEGPEKYE